MASPTRGFLNLVLNQDLEPLVPGGRNETHKQKHSYAPILLSPTAEASSGIHQQKHSYAPILPRPTAEASNGTKHTYVPLLSKHSAKAGTHKKKHSHVPILPRHTAEASKSETKDHAGLQRTDNNMAQTIWPQVNMINQKNYYTEFLKRDDQILPLRLQQEERRNRMTTKAKDRDRELAQSGTTEVPTADADMDVDDDVGMDDTAGLGSKVIVIHPGSQNLRIGLANDPLPKTIPMVVARRWAKSESEEGDGEPKPKRLKTDDGSTLKPEKMFGDEFASQYSKLSAELKIHMRQTKRKVLPNSKELVVNFNKRYEPEVISEHNDPLRIDWTELPRDPKDAPGHITGHEALRIPDDSTPRYKLFWPLQHGWYNEKEYEQKNTMFDDVSIILEDAIKNQLNIRRKRDWAQYGCVYVIPDLYEKRYVVQALDMLMRDFGFGRVCFMQESIAATFGCGVMIACIVDVGAQKTSICCVDEGMCIENSRVNLKYGGADVTDTFFRMMLHDRFPYQDINLKRRYDYLLAEELKCAIVNMNEDRVVGDMHEFHVRAPGQQTRKYQFKVYDEPFLACQGFFNPTLFDNTSKLEGRRKVLPASEDLYDGSPNDPVSSAQSSILADLSPPAVAALEADRLNSTPGRQPSAIPSRLNDATDRSSPGPESLAGDDDDTPAPAADDAPASTRNILATSMRDDVLPIMSIDRAIMTSIEHGARGDPKKLRDFAGGVQLLGGCAMIPGFSGYLEGRLRQVWKEYTVAGGKPKDLNNQVVMWKGGSVFGRMRGTNDSWIGQHEYDRLGARVLAYKCMWAW